jgi:hypothetical protein
MATNSTPLDVDILTVDFPVNTKCAMLNAIWGAEYTVEQVSQNPCIGDSYLYYLEQ